MNKQTGITLIETLIVLVIAGVLLSLSLPTFAGLKARSDVAATHNLLMGGFAAAREAAVVHRQSAVICPGDAETGCRKDGIWEGGWILFLDRNGDGKLAGNDTLLRSETTGSSDIAIRSSKHRPRVTFQPNGMAEGSNLTVKLCDAQGQAIEGVVMSNTGRARASTDKEVAAMAVCF